MGQVRWTHRARSDIKAIREYIAVDNDVAALRTVARIVARVEQLRTFPKSGRLIPEHAESGVRELIVRPYRIAYQLDDESVWILKVHHGARILHREDIER